MPTRIVGFGLAAAVATLGWSPAASAATCDRACLEGTVDSYMSALASQDVEAAPLAADARYTENGQELVFGDGLWGTITGLGSYRVYMTDPDAGQVAFFGTIREAETPATFALRANVVDGRMTEVETFVQRGSSFPTPGKPGAILLEESGPRPGIADDIPLAERLSRERLIEIADGYFESMEQGSSEHTPFHERCTRIENGNQTAGHFEFDPEMPGSDMRNLHCAQQFDTGFSKRFSVVPMRRYPVVDQERGLVLAIGALQHDGRLKMMQLASGEERPVAEIFRKPFQFTFAEFFKIHEGRIGEVEAVLLTVPYGMKSGWDDESMTDPDKMHGVRGATR